MKRIASSLAVAFLSVVGIAHAKTADDIARAGTPDQQGVALATELASRNSGYRDFAGDVEMTLQDSGGSSARRHFQVKLLEHPVANSGDYSLLQFDSPADVKGTAVLSHAQIDGEDEQWIFLPALHRVKRISSSNRTGSFVGSEFSFEDLTGNEGRKYTWKVLGTEACGTLQCLTVETTPRDPGSSYSRRLLHVDTTELRVQSVDFYDRRGALLKTLAYDDYQKLDGRFWRARRWTMTNKQSGKSTVVQFTSMKLGNGYTLSDFGTGKLGN